MSGDVGDAGHLDDKPAGEPPVAGENRDDNPLMGRSGPEDRGEARETFDARSMSELTNPGVDKHPVTGGAAVAPSDPAAMGNPSARSPIDLDEDDIPH